MIEPSRWRTAVVESTDHLAAVPSSALATAVPTCPGWDVERLLRHLARVQGWVTGVLATEPGEAPPDAPRPAVDEPIGAFVARMGADLVARMDQTGPDRSVPGFTGTVPAAFWSRRMAHEATLHRWDVDEALDPAGPHAIAADLAVDGVDEVLEVMVPRRFDLAAFGPTGETLHLHATDADGEWLVRFAPDGPPEVRREHAKGDAAVRGPASDLLLALWGRRGPDDLEVLGDVELVRRYQAAARY